MDINDFKDILRGFWKQVVGSTYKDPLMIYDFDVMLAMVGRTVGVPEKQVDELKAIIEQAKKTGKINEKKVKGLFKGITQTEGPPQILNLVLDTNVPVAQRVSKLLEIVLFPSYKGLYRNMVDSGKGTNYELNTKFQRLDIQDVVKRMPDGPTGFVPSYTNLFTAASLIYDEIIAFQPYRKVVNMYDDIEKINQAQSDVFIEAAEKLAKDNPNMKVINPSGEIDVFDMTMDKYNALSTILDVVLADMELVKKFGWRDILDPEVAKEIDKATNGDLRKAFQQAKKKPKMDPKAKSLIQKLQEWKATQPNSWFGSPFTLINSGQLGVEDEALRIYRNTEVEKNVNGNTGGSAPSGLVNSYKGKANLERQKLFGLEEIYASPDGYPGQVIDSAEVLKYIENNASPDLINHIRDLERIGFEDVLEKLSRTWVGTSTHTAYESNRGILPDRNVEVTNRYWNQVSGNAAELSIAKQMNVKQADINIITLRATQLDDIALKTAMYSLYGEWKLPTEVSIYKAEFDGFTDVNIKKDYLITQQNINRVADELRKARPDLKRNAEYWRGAAEKKLNSQLEQVSDKKLSINNYYTAGEDVDGNKVKKHTLIIDLDTIRHNLLAEALQAFSDAVLGDNKVIIRDGKELKIVDKTTGASKLFPLDDAIQIHLTGQTGPLSPYQRDMLTRLVQSLVSPDNYLKKLAEPQIRKQNIADGKPNHTQRPIALNSYKIAPEGNIQDIIQEGAVDFSNPNISSDISLLAEGKLNGFLIRESNLLSILNARNVKDAVNTLNKQPVIRLVNFDTGEEIFVDVQGWEKMDPYKLNKPEFVEELKSVITDQTQLSLRRTYNNKTDKWETGGPQTFEFDQYIEYVKNQGTKRFDKKSKSSISAKPFWLLKTRTEPKNPLVEQAKIIRQTLLDIERAQQLYDKYWSYGQDPKAITRIGKRNVPGKVYNLMLIDARYENIIRDLYKDITSYDLGPRDFDTTRLMHNLASDVYKGESLQEIVNALLTDRLELTNAYKAVDAEQLELAKKNNLLGKLNMFYKLMGRPNAVLQAITLNISKELNSGNFDQEAFFTQVSQALESIKTAEDIIDLPESFKQAMDSTNGSHSQFLAAKVLETMHALLQEEFEMFKKYPELNKLYDSLRAVDTIDLTRQGPDMLETIPEDVGDMMVQLPPQISAQFKDGKYYEFTDQLFKSYRGIGYDYLNQIESNYHALSASGEHADLYANRFDALNNRRASYDLVRNLTQQLRNIQALQKSGMDSTSDRLTEEELYRRARKLLENPKLKEEFFKTFDVTDKLRNGPGAIEAALKDSDLLGSMRPAVIQTALDALANWSNYYLATEYLRVDNIFGLETNTKNLNGEDVNGKRPFPIYGTNYANDFLPYILTEGLENHYHAAPTALHAILMNDLNLNPAVQDNFINKLLKEYADEIITPTNMNANMQSLAPLIGQATLLSPEGFKMLLDELYTLNGEAPLADVDFSDDKQVKRFIERVYKDIATLRAIGPAKGAELANIMEDLFGEDVVNMLAEGDVRPLELIIEANLTRLAMRPENINKLLDAEAALTKEGLPTWEGFKQQLLKSTQNKLLTGEGDFIDVPKETVEYLKQATKQKVDNLARVYKMLLDPNSNLKITVKSNIPDKWDIKVNQNKTFNPFEIAPAFGSDAFYHIEIGRKDETISWRNTLGDIEIGLLIHMIQVEQPNNYVNTMKTLGNEYSSVLRSGYQNSYLYSNTLSETVEADIVNDMLRKEANSLRAYLKQLERQAIKDTIKEDKSKIKAVQESFKYLNEMIDSVIIQAENLNSIQTRQNLPQIGTRAFYGLDDIGAYPLAKVKFNNILSTPEDITLFHILVMPMELQNKALNVKDIADIQKLLTNENVNLEVGQYVEALQDLTEKKLGRKNLQNGLQLANEINEILFYDKKNGLLSPPEELSKEFKFVNREQELYFRKLMHDHARGIDISKYPVLPDMPNPVDVNNYLSKTYNIYEGPYLKDRWGMDFFPGKPQFTTAAEWVESVKEKYGIIKDRKALPQLGPVDGTNFKDFGALMNLQFARDFNTFDIANTEEAIQMNAYKNGILNIIETGLQDPSRAIFNYTNGALNYDLGIPQLPAGDVPNKLVVRGPVGWTITTPPVYGEPIPMADGLPKMLMPRGPIDMERGAKFGEGDPFADARTAPRAVPTGRGSSNTYQGIKNVVQFLRVAGYQPARYKWNFIQTQPKGIQVYSPPRPSNQLPGKSNVGFMRRYFTNLRTLKELPYFYNRTTGRGAGRAYLFLMGANPNTGFNASANLVPTQPGVELNPKEFENFYRQNKKAYLQQKNLTPARAYGKAVHYAFLADMGLAMVNYNKNVGDMTYEDFLESSYTENGAKQLHYIFKPITFIFEQPYKVKQKIINEREKATAAYNAGELGLTEYQNKLTRLNVADAINKPSTFIVDEMGKAFLGLREFVGSIGRGFELARQNSEMTADKFQAKDMDEWSAKVDKSNEELARTKHLTYNYGDDYYNRGRRLVNNLLVNAAERRKAGENIEEEITFDNSAEETLWTSFGQIGLQAGTAGTGR